MMTPGPAPKRMNGSAEIIYRSWIDAGGRMVFEEVMPRDFYDLEKDLGSARREP